MNPFTLSCAALLVLRYPPMELSEIWKECSPVDMDEDEATVGPIQPTISPGATTIGSTTTGPTTTLAPECVDLGTGIEKVCGKVVIMLDLSDINYVDQQLDLLISTANNLDLNDIGEDSAFSIGGYGCSNNEGYWITNITSPADLCHEIEDIRHNKSIHAGYPMTMTLALENVVECLCVNHYNRVIMLSTSDDITDYNSTLAKYNLFRGQLTDLFDLEIVAQTETHLDIPYDDPEVKILQARSFAEYDGGCVSSSFCREQLRCDPDDPDVSSTTTWWSTSTMSAMTSWFTESLSSATASSSSTAETTESSTRESASTSSLTTATSESSTTESSSTTSSTTSSTATPTSSQSSTMTDTQATKLSSTTQSTSTSSSDHHTESTLTTPFAVSTQTVSSSPILPPILMNVTGCGCNVSGVYLDIVLVVDVSDSWGARDLNAVVYYLETVVMPMTIGQGPGQVTRIGLVEYANKAELIYPLTQFTSVQDFLDTFQIKLTKDESANDLLSGVQLAVNHLVDESREVARPVIIIITPTFNIRDFPDPTNEATQFKKSGGIIITLDYFEANDLGAEGLSKLASPNYALSNQNETLHAAQLRNLFCEANCYCELHWQHDPNEVDDWLAPTQGCYRTGFVESTYLEAQQQCRSQSGVLVSIDSLSKATFIQDEERLTTEQRIGLVCVGTDCGWDDGSPVTFDLFKTPPAEDGGQLCAVQERIEDELAWRLLSCQQQIPAFTCERPACSSEYFCPFQWEKSFREILKGT